MCGLNSILRSELKRRFLFLVGLFFIGSGCGSMSNPPGTIDASLTNCSPGVAQIQVGDGFFRIFCGCTFPGEAAGTVFPAPGRLTCHLPTNNSQVIFYFLGNVMKHQIIPVGPTTFAPSGLSDPNSDMPIRAHTVSFQTAATTYSFQDVISGMTGQIFVP
jgi:hypothetical protein